MWRQSKAKYGNKTITTPEGKFDGKYEWERWLFLKEAAKNGQISALRRQVEFTLIPRQTKTKITHLKTKDKIEEAFAEHPVTYIADFVYEKNGETIVEDFKGVRTDVYVVKRKLMLYVHGISIREVERPTEPL